MEGKKIFHFIFFIFNLSSSKKNQENSRTSPKLHSNPLYLYIYMQNVQEKF